MKRSSKRLESEWRNLVLGWQKSGETQREYCRRHGVPLSTFQYWRQRLKRERSESFIELMPAVSEESSGGEIELKLPHGITLRISR